MIVVNYPSVTLEVDIESNCPI